MGTTAQIQIRQRLAEFFMGKLYPLVVALIVTVGHIMETEFYFNVINVALAVVALCVCDSIRPMFITVTTFIFQVSKTNAPAWPIFSDYYFTEWRLPIILCLGALALFGIVFFVLKNRLLCRIKLFGTRLLLPALVLSLAFLLNGVASQSWSVSAFGFGASQIIVYLVLFLLFYLGLSERDNAESLVDYVSYIALVISYMIIVQMIHLFVFGNVISASGSILKDNINLGWTISNPLASILLSLIPALFLGAMRKKCGWIYFVTAVLVFISAFMTLSRNSMLFGTILFVVCVVVLCVRSPKMRRGILISSVVSLAALFVFAVIMRDSIAVVFDQLIKAGFGSTGRFEIWAEAWEHFLDNMLFGAGFFNLEDSATLILAKFMPFMAHNTVLEMLSSAGIFGLLAYLYYQIEAARVFLCRPTLIKSMLALSFFIVCVQSMLDVFAFCYYPMFFPMVALATACHMSDIAEKNELKTSIK